MKNPLWTCSACSLACEDLQMGLTENQLTLQPACGLAERQLQQRISSSGAVAYLNGQPVDPVQAIDALATIWDSARDPVLRGRFCDLQTARSAVAFAAASNAVIDLPSSATLRSLFAAVCRDGATMATLGDVRQHADRVVLIGDCLTEMPRLAERFFPGVPPLLLLERDADFSVSADSMSPGAVVQRLDSSWSSWLRAQQSDPSGMDHAVAGYLQDGKYTALILAANALDQDELAATWLLKWIEQLSESMRAVLVAPDQSTAAKQVLLWRAGFSGPVRFRDQIPEPLEKVPCGDVQLILQPSLPLVAPKQLEQQIRTRRQAGQQTILLGDQATPVYLSAAADLFLALDWPGQECGGTTVRGDGSVTLPLPPLNVFRNELPEPFNAEQLFAEVLLSLNV
ncbi:hypothetical protein FF011L_08060 [Roseimaritima multifibrata]|uniref:Formylmethanofuran dehydrogenase subunit B n=1 Tax=Roseimaritima multifibrata TaxID=1930274 RepID=A0A517MB11_9BACT|nr:hypothetical protein [Roseimaritima multifibrata]QDS92070.1 hypothetical protein FF011L_08060 [Roseimaritima multifibrata]